MFNIRTVKVLRALLNKHSLHLFKAYMDGYTGYPECVVFALAACACQKISEPLRTQAYNALKTVCKTSKDLFLFVSFTKKLSTPHKGIWPNYYSISFKRKLPTAIKNK